VAVYLLLGLGWAFAYRLVAIARPDAFAFPAGTAVALDEEHTWRLVYFSFVTLTTVGYGDITAAHPVARSLVVCEALVGQLFPAILLARLVSMEIYHRQSRNK
jgi:voltage-gated potassium channel Kch